MFSKVNLMGSEVARRTKESGLHVLIVSNHRITQKKSPFSGIFVYRESNSLENAGSKVSTFDVGTGHAPWIIFRRWLELRQRVNSYSRTLYMQTAGRSLQLWRFLRVVHRLYLSVAATCFEALQFQPAACGSDSSCQSWRLAVLLPSSAKAKRYARHSGGAEIGP